MSLFCNIARSFSNRRHCFSFTLQLIWGNVISVSAVARVFTFELRGRRDGGELEGELPPLFYQRGGNGGTGALAYQYNM